jgi:hypothetical protein
LKLFGERAVFFVFVFVMREGETDVALQAFFQQPHLDEHIFRRVFEHHFVRIGRIGFADACKEQAQVIVDFGYRAYCRAWIFGNGFLFNGNCRRYV